MVKRHLFGFCIDPAESVTHDISEPDVILSIHFDAPHKGGAWDGISLDLACFRIHSVDRAFWAVRAPAIIVRIHSQVVSTYVIRVELFCARIESERFRIARGPNVAGRILAKCESTHSRRCSELSNL